MRPTAYIFGIKQFLVVPYANPDKHVGLSPVLWIKSFHRLIMEKTFKKKFFYETMRPIAYIFDMKQFLVVPYLNPADQAVGVQTGPAPGIKSFHRLIMEKTLKKNSSMKP